MKYNITETDGVMTITLTELNTEDAQAIEAYVEDLQGIDTDNYEDKAGPMKFFEDHVQVVLVR